MSNRPVVLVPAERETNVELVTQIAKALVAPENADIHILNVTPPTASGRAYEDWRGLPRSPKNGQSARSATATLSAIESTVLDVRLRGKGERIIPAYAQLAGARVIVVDRHYGTAPLWRNTATVARMSRRSPVPILVLPSERPALERLARGNISRVIAAVDFTLASAVALRTAVTLAGRHDARLTMVHALQNFPGHSVFSGGEAWRVVQKLSAQKTEIGTRLQSEARRFGRAASRAQVITGDPARGIVNAASETDADVIVMGVAPRTWLDRSAFGSTLGPVLRRAEIPVLVIPVVGGDQEWSEDTISGDVMEFVLSESIARTAA